MAVFLSDIRYASRTLLKNRAFTLAAVLALALGIGANTAIFTVIDAVLLRPLPYPDSDRIVQVMRGYPSGQGPTISIAKYLFWKRHSTAVDHMAAFDFLGPGVALGGSGEPEQVKAIHVAADYFPLFGARTVVGRTFLAEEDRPGGAPVAVIGHGLWKRRFGADPGLLGGTVTLAGEPHTVVGVLAADFQPYPAAEVWLPLKADAASISQAHYVIVAGRLKPGVSLAAAKAQLRVVGEQFRAAFPDAMGSSESVTASLLQREMAGDIRPALLVLGGAVMLVLLIACANVANLLLARAAGRSREIALRMALGAGRGRLVRQLMTESIVLALAGGALGLVLGAWGVKALLAISPGNVPRAAEIGMLPDANVLLFTLAVSLVTGVLFGLAPALGASRRDLAESLKEGGGRTTPGLRRNRARGLLVITELALALVLLAGAALLLRSFLALRNVNPGFDARGVLTMKVSLAGARYAATAPMADFARRVAMRLEALPGVEAAAMVTNLPFEQGPDLPMRIEGRAPDAANAGGSCQWRAIGPHYFQAMRIPLLRGRAFGEGDAAGAPQVVIVNDAFARRHWPGYAEGKENPIGRRVVIGVGMGPEFADSPREIVGIVGDTRDVALATPPGPAMYVPGGQVPNGASALINKIVPGAIVMRAAVDPMSLAQAVRREILAVDAQLPVFDLRSMEQVAAASMARQNFQMVLLGAFASVALLLAAIGVYGVISYSVEQRTNEIGIRMALGAGAGQMVRLVVGQAMRLAGAGLALGLAASFAATRVLSGMLFGVQPTDPVAYAAVAIVLGAVALAASYVPARRATRVNPIAALRCE
jgi:putative ABC transport system permease protein